MPQGNDLRKRLRFSPSLSVNSGKYLKYPFSLQMIAEASVICTKPQWKWTENAMFQRRKMDFAAGNEWQIALTFLYSASALIVIRVNSFYFRKPCFYCCSNLLVRHSPTDGDPFSEESWTFPSTDDGQPENLISSAKGESFQWAATSVKWASRNHVLIVDEVACWRNDSFVTGSRRSCFIGRWWVISRWRGRWPQTATDWMTGKMLRIILTKSLPAQCSSLIFPNEESSLSGRWTCPKWVKSRMMMSMHFQFMN